VRREVFGLGWWSDRCGSVKGAETARKGCGDVEGPKRVRLGGESRKSKPRRRGADLRIPDGRDYRSVGDLACKRPVKPITVIFNRSFSIIYLLCSRQPRDVFFYLNFSFLLGK
jgi:hypothetical protein